MAHFVKLNNDNIVEDILVISNDDILDKKGKESEKVGQTFIKSLGIEGRWIQTSYGNKFRKRFAGIGFKYDSVNDVFIDPQPFPSWKLNDNFDWEAPKPMPTDGLYIWNEESLDWESA